MITAEVFVRSAEEYRNADDSRLPLMFGYSPMKFESEALKKAGTLMFASIALKIVQPAMMFGCSPLKFKSGALKLEITFAFCFRYAEDSRLPLMFLCEALKNTGTLMFASIALKIVQPAMMFGCSPMKFECGAPKIEITFAFYFRCA